jgi:hypothetical protein
MPYDNEVSRWETVVVGDIPVNAVLYGSNHPSPNNPVSILHFDSLTSFFLLPL